LFKKEKKNSNDQSYEIEEKNCDTRKYFIIAKKKKVVRTKTFFCMYIIMSANQGPALI